ncbi:MAG: hypothetical protein IKM72_16005 [Oscillospiraceae bacterium]|nr:hypothetical protein [Oscillospiraceae bacterium]
MKKRISAKVLSVLLTSSIVVTASGVLSLADETDSDITDSVITVDEATDEDSEEGVIESDPVEEAAGIDLTDRTD